MWRGTISFGMVAIPVRLHVATEERSSVSFHLICKKDGSRLRNLRWCPQENREVPWDEVVRGYEIGKDEYVVLTSEDLEHLAQISWLDGTLVLETLHWPEEIRDTRELKLPGRVSVGKPEVDMALMLVESMSRPLMPSEYHDEYREALLAAARRGGGDGHREAAPSRPRASSRSGTRKKAG